MLEPITGEFSFPFLHVLVAKALMKRSIIKKKIACCAHVNTCFKVEPFSSHELGHFCDWPQRDSKINHLITNQLICGQICVKYPCWIGDAIKIVKLDPKRRWWCRRRNEKLAMRSVNNMNLDIFLYFLIANFVTENPV